MNDPAPLSAHVHPPVTGALARAIERRDWERACLYLLDAALLALRDLPHDGIDEAINLLTGDDDDDAF